MDKSNQWQASPAIDASNQGAIAVYAAVMRCSMHLLSCCSKESQGVCSPSLLAERQMLHHVAGQVSLSIDAPDCWPFGSSVAGPPRS